MKRVNLTMMVFVVFFLSAGVQEVKAQSVKINIPTTIVGTPNIGYEHTIGQKFSISGDVLWAPYLFKKHEEVFRALIGTVEFRYYIKPKYYYTNNTFDGFYIGPYAMIGNFNVGLYKGEDKESFRYKGWGMSSGISLGYKFYLSQRLRLDVNLGLGYAHLQYDTYELGGEWAEYPLSKKDTKMWIGPTKFGVNLVYNIFK